jgi:hypothetical protein
MSRKEKRVTDRVDETDAKQKPVVSIHGQVGVGDPKTYNPEDLDDRKVRGILLFEAISRYSHLCIPIDDTQTLYFSTKNESTTYRVVRTIRNHRGVLTVDYRCVCPDYKKDGRNDCAHIFCDRLRRKEAIVIGTISPRRARSAKAKRRERRKRITDSRESIHTTQRKARVTMGSEIPRLLTSLRRLYLNRHPLSKNKVVGGQLTPDVNRAMALIYKISRSKSADEMVLDYEALVENGFLDLRDAPHQNTISQWMNDLRLTPVLEELLRMTSAPFRKREKAAIVDSSKFSQLRSASARGVQYLGDEREGAEWMKCHAIVGVETMVVMAAKFTKNYGEGTADTNFTKPLVTEALKTFSLEYLLADKAYGSDDVINWLWHFCGILAFVPVKKNTVQKGLEYELENERINYFDNKPREFHECYRFRPKIEAFFSLLKQKAGSHCWSLGRPRAFDDIRPCDAWINETMCKLIYMNLRTTVTLQAETGWTIDYPSDRCFPEPVEPLMVA